MKCKEYNEWSVLCLSCIYPSNIKCCIVVTDTDNLTNETDEEETEY